MSSVWPGLSRFLRWLLASLFITAALILGWLSILMFVEAFSGQGSVEGKTLLGMLGLLLLLCACVILMAGIMNWKRLGKMSAQRDRDLR